MHRQSFLLIVTVGFVLVGLNLCRAASFQGLGYLPGGSYSEATAVSADGSVVVGTSATASGVQAFRWTAGEGIVGVPIPTGMIKSWGTGVSADGQFVLGYGRQSDSPPYGNEGFRRHVSGTMDRIALPGFEVIAKGISGDGSAAVGTSWGTGIDEEAFQWTASGGIVRLAGLHGTGVRSNAEAVSTDGLFVVGNRIYDGEPYGDCFRWTPGEIVGFTAHTANAVSSDGSVVVGGLDNHDTALFEAYRWRRETGITLLGTCLPNFHSRALAVSGDGSVIVGYVQNNSGFDEQKAFIWDEEHGMRLLQDVLEDDFGLDLSDWMLSQAWTSWKATGISADGLTIVGVAQNSDGQREAWRAMLANVIYVDAGAALGGDGTSWGTAYKYLQDALDEPLANGDEIWVAAGTYYPDEDESGNVVPSDRTESFELVTGVGLYGGFPAGGGTWKQRDPKTYATILSGDLNGDDGPDFSFYEDNSYHVVIGSDRDRSAVLDGFTIRGGSAMGSYPYNYGGGMTCERGSPTIVDCVFASNQAQYYGGGLYNRDGEAKLLRCDFISNYAHNDGGAVKNWDGANLELVHCRFLGNRAGRGGGVSEYSGLTTMINCLFSGNKADSTNYGSGGAVVASYGTVNMINCTLVGNAAWGTDSTGRGGGVYVSNGTANLTNCLVWDNQDEGGIDASAQIHVDSGTTNLHKNCILGWGGVGTNIGADPNMLDANGADQVYGTEDDNPRLTPGSSCLDMGDNTAVPADLTTDLDGLDRIQGIVVDIGAYEGDRQGILVETDYLVVAEGTTQSFWVELAKEPDATVQVEVEIASGDPDIVISSGQTLIFEAENYYVRQQVYVTALADADQLQGTAIVRLSAAGFRPTGLTVQEQEANPTPVIYVDQSATGANDGSRWAYAFVDLQDGIQFARTHPEILAIHVAQGVYRPTTLNGDRNISFELLRNVSVLGGFPVGGGTLEQRDAEAYETILSGDLNGNDLPVTESQDLLTAANRDDNSRHVVRGYLSDETAVLDGFTIRGGHCTTGYTDNYGGGVFLNFGCRATVRNCRFQFNAAGYGGGLYGNAILEQCILRQNAANYGGAVGRDFELRTCLVEENYAVYSGGGIYVRESYISDCQIRRNRAGISGGGICVDVADETCFVVRCMIIDNQAYHGGGAASIGCTCGGYPIYVNCRFLGNHASEEGGGLFSEGYIFNTLTNCEFSGNTAGLDGGALYDGYDSSSDLYDCTIAHNRADRNVGGAAFDYPRDRFVSNTIFWGNEDQSGNGQSAQFSSGTPVPSMNYCCVQGLLGDLGGLGNIGANPNFIDADGPDNQAGTADDNLRLQVHSPCIDTGNNGYIGEDIADLDGDGATTEPIPYDLAGKDRIGNEIVDMGAYEFHGPQVIYVDADATGANDGSSWADAYRYLQDGLTGAGYGDEIRVAQGSYQPDQGGGNTLGSPEATFRMVVGVTIKGGYAGFGEPDPNERKATEYETVLNGDLARNDVSVSDAADLIDEPSREDNSYHVVTGSGMDETAVLDGFTVRGGNAHREYSVANNGGGVYVLSGTPTLVNCRMEGNVAVEGGGLYIKAGGGQIIGCIFRMNAAWNGGGMYNDQGDPILTDCTFHGNQAEYEGGGFFHLTGAPVLTGCVFTENRSDQDGGGMQNDEGSPHLIRCVFYNNVAEDEGGGMCNEDTQLPPLNPVLLQCVFVGNRADGHGGGLCNDRSSPEFKNCTFNDNRGSRGGGIYSENGAAPKLTNCILWSDHPEEIYDAGSTTLVTYSDIEGDWKGLGNIDADPYFADPDKNEFHLKSEAGRWDPTSESWVIDSVTSPCIDKGNPGTGLGEESASIHNVRINMGAYGGTTEASKAPVEWGLLADLTNDGIVNGEDFVWQAMDWLRMAKEQAGDLNRDGIINVQDLEWLTGDWLGEASWY